MVEEKLVRAEESRDPRRREKQRKVFQKNCPWVTSALKRLRAES